MTRHGRMNRLWVLVRRWLASRRCKAHCHCYERWHISGNLSPEEFEGTNTDCFRLRYRCALCLVEFSFYLHAALSDEHSTYYKNFECEYGIVDGYDPNKDYDFAFVENR